MIWILVCLPLGAWADDRLVRLYAPVELIETGVMRHILPRFTLKTQVRVELVASPDQADMAWGTDGVALFQHGEMIWQMALQDAPHAGTARFADWLSGEVGQRTILGFAPEGTPLFLAPAKVAEAEIKIEYDGDPKAGFTSAKTKCGRCHAVDDGGRMNDIGSTPSFFVLRVFENWEDRILSFYVLRPHRPFTQIKGVTEPFAINAPPAIKPIEMTLDELDDVVAYVATLEAAELGAPLVHQ
ncbi:cytochrome c [Sulfitobacter sp. SK012]|uniref:cytochrome c n=1 Tax=Sulfitobacter sp. SK012 TaxID=1389005 RepID=UPI0013B45E26|nr:cytochrome c [Sulfitobacter sp. SK012]